RMLDVERRKLLLFALSRKALAAEAVVPIPENFTVEPAIFVPDAALMTMSCRPGAAARTSEFELEFPQTANCAADVSSRILPPNPAAKLLVSVTLTPASGASK